jgi:hypothetical protein
MYALNPGGDCAGTHPRRYTQTHTHTQRERERERETDRGRERERERCLERVEVLIHGGEGERQETLVLLHTLAVYAHEPVRH